MEKLTINKLPKASIRELSSLSNSDLAKLAKEADETLSEARRLKNWVYGAITLKNSISNHGNNNNNNGGNYEQATYY